VLNTHGNLFSWDLNLPILQFETCSNANVYKFLLKNTNPNLIYCFIVQAS